MIKTTDQVETKLDQVKRPPNPEGKGGFQDRPQDRNPGGWKKVQTFRYWFDLFKEMTVDELKQWAIDNPHSVRTVAADLALARILNAQKNLKEFREVANRSEGMPKLTIEHQGKVITKVKVEIVENGKSD